MRMNRAEFGRTGCALLAGIVWLAGVATYAEPPAGDGEWLFEAEPRRMPLLERPGRPGWDPDSSGYDALHVALDVETHFADSSITASAAWTLQVTADLLAEIGFDFSTALQVSSVAVNGQPTPFTHEAERLRVFLPATVDSGAQVRIDVAYAGRPDAPHREGFVFDEHNGAHVAYTTCEPFGATIWWPCKDRPDDKFTAEFAFTVPDSMIATASGTLIATQPLHDQRTRYVWSEQYPITTYLVSLTATNFVDFHDIYIAADGTTMPLDYYAYPEDLPRAMSDWAFTPQAIRFLADLFGEYPFLEEKYGMAEYPWIGAMEHQTLTSMGEYFLRLDHPSDWVVVHELAHQWWGNWVTCGTWRDIWLNEGFATYCEALWAEHLAGPDSLRYQMERFRRDSYRGTVYDPDYIFNSTVYRKGAWVLHMLRHVVGDDLFFQALRVYGERHAYGNAITPEFQGDVESVCGTSLDWFFQQWVYGEGQPRYRVNWYPNAVSTDGTTQIEVVVVQETTGPNFFKMPLDARFFFADGTEFTAVLWDSLAEQKFLVETAAMPESLSVDPDGWVLGRVLYVADPTGVHDHDDGGLDLRVQLAQPRPNPLTASTSIPFVVLDGNANWGFLTLHIRDGQGRLVRTLRADRSQSSFVWDGRDLGGQRTPAGVYFAEIARTSSPCVKLIVIR